jgi:hypothetical protein
MKRLEILCVVVLMLASSVAMAAQEKTIGRRDLPPAVEKTVVEQSQGATIRGFSTEVENGIRVYEAKLIVDGHAKDISMDAQGHVLEVEEEVPFASLPTAIQRGLRTAAGAGTLGRIESLTKHGKIVAYESVVTMGTKRHEIQVDTHGKRLTRLQ